MAKHLREFSQQEALTTRLANILEEYPLSVGSTVAEWAQNADDAGASVFGLVVDGRTARNDLPLTPCGGEALPDMIEMARRPALYVYNSAQFSDADLENIISLGNSMKRESGASIGKYGLGANVMYSFTDTPMFISRSSLVVFDPHGHRLPGGMLGTITDYMACGLAESDPVLASAFDLELAGVFSASLSAHFDGTLFRLPLRTPEDAAASAISSHALSIDDVTNLLSDFAPQASDMLLFLKSVSTVFAHVLTDDGLTTLITTEIVGLGPELAAKRALLLDVVAGERQALHASFELRFTESSDILASRPAPRWWVAVGTLDTLDADAEALAKAVGYVPWAGTALPLHQLPPNWHGRAYTFLPLPITTGFPFHINGAFALSANRRQLWRGDAELSDAAATKGRWNSFLLNTVLPSIVIRAFVDSQATQLALDPLAHLPVLASTPPPFDDFAHALYTAVTSLGPDAPALFPDPRSPGSFAPLHTFTLMDPEFAATASSHMFTALIAADVALLALPTHVQDALDALDVPLPTTSPAMLASALRRVVAVDPALLTRDVAVAALNYVLSGASEESALARLACLDGLAIVPLRGGGLGTLRVTNAPHALAAAALPLDEKRRESKAERAARRRAARKAEKAERKAKAKAAKRRARGQELEARLECGLEPAPELKGSMPSFMPDTIVLPPHPQFLGLIPDDAACLDMDCRAAAVLAAPAILAVTNIVPLGLEYLTRFALPRFLDDAFLGMGMNDALVLSGFDAGLRQPFGPRWRSLRRAEPHAAATGREILNLAWSLLASLQLSTDAIRRACAGLPMVVTGQGVAMTLDAAVAHFVLAPDELDLAGESAALARDFGVLSLAAEWAAEAALAAQLLPAHWYDDGLLALAVCVPRGACIDVVSDADAAALCLAARDTIANWANADASVLHPQLRPEGLDRLPLFESLDGSSMLASPRADPMRPLPLPRGEGWAIARKSLAALAGLRIIKTDGSARTVLGLVGAGTADFTTFMRRVLLPRLRKLPRAVIEEHMSVELAAAIFDGLVPVMVLPWQGDDAVMSMVLGLRGVPLLPSSSGWRTASEVHDPDSELLARIERAAAASTDGSIELVFPSHAFSTPGVLTVLRALGMTDLTAPECMFAAARAVAELRDAELAREFVASVVQHARQWPVHQLRELGAIAFVPAYDLRGAEMVPTHLLPSLPFNAVTSLETQACLGFQAQKYRVDDLVSAQVSRRQPSGAHTVRFDDALARAHEQLRMVTGSTSASEIPSAVVTFVAPNEASILAMDASVGFRKALVLPAELDRAPLRMLSAWGVPHPPPASVVASNLTDCVAMWAENGVRMLASHNRLAARNAEAYVHGTVLLHLAYLARYLAAMTDMNWVAALAPVPSDKFGVIRKGSSGKRWLISQLRALPVVFVYSDLEHDLADDVRALPSSYLPVQGLLEELGVHNLDHEPLILPRVTAEAPNTLLGPIVAAAFNDARLADVVVRSRSGREWFAHRLVLGTSSAYFASAFESGMCANEGGVIALTTPHWASDSAYDAMMQHMYIGDGWLSALKETLEDVMTVTEVLRLSDVYMLPRLKQVCELWLASGEAVAILNLCTLYALADATNAVQLQTAIAYHMRQVLPALIKTDDWGELSDEQQSRIMH
ncbi:sacsin [Thecamonas trahens ATCC 50062]|uniref:Sacsin n=1 Tax=Thecamonas trahens ATCC 50062 TaxID=461836 RepID=A0A0L0D259_THETB|nr:sacsin [Thecamonas trahens ATCC 50062]KNC46434.1 sacsin [Thecamonas trahens ATCC 50062]|eukprot:XP_013760725.1 sacsin [Thecamonas trahens ATCC 50062]